MKIAAGEGVKSVLCSMCTKEESASDDISGSDHEIEVGTKEEERRESHPLTRKGGSLRDREDVSCNKDTEKLVSRDSGGTRTMYSSSSKCCKTKASIIISKTTFLLVGVAVLVVGAVVAGTVRHHPTEGQCSNSSLVDQFI